MMKSSSSSVKPQPKALWITKDTEHALSYRNHRDEYLQKVTAFIFDLSY